MIDGWSLLTGAGDTGQLGVCAPMEGSEQDAVRLLAEDWGATRAPPEGPGGAKPAWAVRSWQTQAC